MNIEIKGKEAINILEQNSLKTYINNIDEDQWIDIYNNKGFGYLCIYSALIPKSRLEDSLNDPCWDLSITNGLPSCWQNGEDIVTYERYGNWNKVEPLVIIRDFHNIKDSYYEISEEFRHFHNLYHDKINDKYIYIDEYGNEDDVILCEKTRVKARLKFLKQFLAIKEMDLAILFDNVVYSPLSLENLGIEAKENIFKSDNMCYLHNIRENTSFKDQGLSSSRLLGKKIIKGFKKEHSGIWPYNENKEKKFVDFIVGECSETGNDIIAACDPYGAYDYLTPLYFKKEVLAKYYNNPSKYSVSDSYLSCGSLWGLQIDDNHEKYISVYLGDIGKSLSYEEQQYWKNFNINTKAGISEVRFKRDFLVEFTEPTNKASLFRHKFVELQKDWKHKYSWELFKELHENDSYHFKTLRIPLNNTDVEFDGQVFSLVKIIIDSLNEKELNINDKNDLKGSISKLENFLNENNFKNFEEHIAFLRDLQDLRSSSVAHRKGKNYDKKIVEKFSLNTKEKIEVFKEILEKMNLFIGHLIESIS